MCVLGGCVVGGRGRGRTGEARVVSGLGGEELGAQVAGFAVGIAALAGLAEFELCVRGEEALVVGWPAEGFFADGLGEGG